MGDKGAHGTCAYLLRPLLTYLARLRLLAPASILQVGGMWDRGDIPPASSDCHSMPTKGQEYLPGHGEVAGWFCTVSLF